MTAEECARLKRLRQVHSREVCAEIMGRARSTLWQCERRGFQPYTPAQRARPRPTDFAIMADRMMLTELSAHYQASVRTVERWAREVARAPKFAGRFEPLPIPKDLAKKVRELGPTRAAKHYGVHWQTLQKWREQSGLPVASRQQQIETRSTGLIGWADRYAAERRGNPPVKETINARR